MNPSLSIELADKEGLAWAQSQVAQFHYLRHPVDVRCRPIAYIITLTRPGRDLLPEEFRDRLSNEERAIFFPGPSVERVGCLIFGRPESTRCTGWYGSVEDVQAGRCRLTRWQILNLSRVWLHPSIQSSGAYYIPNAATQVIAQSLRRVGYDYLVSKPPVWMNEPYEIREVLSYCDTRVHVGTLYRAANFRLVRTNDYGIETYVRPLRRLTHAEKAHIALCSEQDKRAQRLRRERDTQQLQLFESEGAA